MGRRIYSSCRQGRFVGQRLFYCRWVLFVAYYCTSKHACWSRSRAIRKIFGSSCSWRRLVVMPAEDCTKVASGRVSAGLAEAYHT